VSSRTAVTGATASVASGTTPLEGKAGEDAETGLSAAGASELAGFDPRS
jgi:hypothetical protein